MLCMKAESTTECFIIRNGREMPFSLENPIHKTANSNNIDSVGFFLMNTDMTKINIRNVLYSTKNLSILKLIFNIVVTYHKHYLLL